MICEGQAHRQLRVKQYVSPQGVTGGGGKGVGIKE